MKDSAEILVVDDVPANLEVVTDILSSAGYTVAVATGGERALKQLQNYIPDVILLDIQMPGINGFETCQKIKSDTRTANIPVIFITAFSDADSIAKGFSLGAVDYISKPFQEAELLARVETHLKLQHTNQSLEKLVAERTQDLEVALARLQTTLKQLKASQLQLVQREKMSALGNLVAGIAHEINNPVSCVGGNVTELKVSFQEVSKFLQLYQDTFPDPGKDIETMRRQLDIDFLLADIPKMLDSMDAGCDRIRRISNSLRMFSRADIETLFEANIHEGLDNTLLILKYRLQAKDFRPEIQIVREYGELPKIKCSFGQLNQVFMNILANAIDMFDELAEKQSPAELQSTSQQIVIQTQLIGNDAVEVRISDNGKGMPEEVAAKVFDPSFTTKDIGRGTGLGLAIAQQIVVETHGGHLDVQSEIGRGSTFIIRLPVRPVSMA